MGLQGQHDKCSVYLAARAEAMVFQRTTRRIIICCLTAMPLQVASRANFNKSARSQAKKWVYPHEEAINTLHAAGATPKTTSSLLLQRPFQPLGALDGADDDRAGPVNT